MIDRKSIADLRASWVAFSGSARGKRTIRVSRWVFLVLILVYLAWTLTDVGWGRIFDELPTSVTFYVLFLALYLLLPMAEVVMYRLTWDFPAVRSFPAFLKKRIYNREVLGYSGEVYFFAWARRNVALPETRLLETVRDNNIISSVSSTLIVVALLWVFLLAGEMSLTQLIGEGWGWYAAGVAVVVAAVSPLAIRYRRFLFSMPTGTALVIFAIQCVRLLVGQTLQIGQWAVVLPDIPLRIWFTYAAVSLLLTRIPFLPNQNLIFMGAGIQLSGVMDVPKAAIAGMLLVTNVLDKLLNLVLFALISVQEKPAPIETRPTSEQIGS